MREIEWLSRTLILGPHHCLCLEERTYLKAVKRLHINNPDKWLLERASATTHFVKHNTGELCAIVCLEPKATRTMLEHEALLVHEAVHIFQRYCDGVGEEFPSSEFQAYSVQRIALNLMTQFHIMLKDVDKELVDKINKTSRERLGE